MALKCRINEGYCFIHAGKLNRGKKVIRRVLGDVLKMQREKRGGGYCSGSSSSSSNSSAEEATGNELQLEHTAETIYLTAILQLHLSPGAVPNILDYCTALPW